MKKMLSLLFLQCTFLMAVVEYDEDSAQEQIVKSLSDLRETMEETNRLLKNMLQEMKGSVYDMYGNEVEQWIDPISQSKDSK